MSNCEKVKGVWNGEEVTFKRVWNGHYFSDDEVKRLLAGESVTLESINRWGKPSSATGSLKHYTYKGRDCFGFQIDEGTSMGRIHAYRA